MFSVLDIIDDKQKSIVDNMLASPKNNDNYSGSDSGKGSESGDGVEENSSEKKSVHYVPPFKRRHPIGYVYDDEEENDGDDEEEKEEQKASIKNKSSKPTTNDIIENLLQNQRKKRLAFTREEEEKRSTYQRDFEAYHSKTLELSTKGFMYSSDSESTKSTKSTQSYMYCSDDDLEQDVQQQSCIYSSENESDEQEFLLQSEINYQHFNSYRAVDKSFLSEDYMDDFKNLSNFGRRYNYNYRVYMVGSETRTMKFDYPGNKQESQRFCVTKFVSSKKTMDGWSTTVLEQL